MLVLSSITGLNLYCALQDANTRTRNLQPCVATPTVALTRQDVSALAIVEARQWAAKRLIGGMKAVKILGIHS